MDGEIVFYTHDDSLELNETLLSAGELTVDMLNLTPDEYSVMIETFERAKTSEDDCELDALDELLRRHKLFALLAPWAGEDFQHRLNRYDRYLHDIRVFNTTIQNFIQHVISRLLKNDPENYAAALYDFYTDPRMIEKLIVTPLNHGTDCYTTHDSYALSYVPREMADGHFAICEKHSTDSVQAVLKADYMHALNAGRNILRCKVCGKYFLLKGGAHALYCEGACPYDSRFTCRQFGTHEVQKELAWDIPKLRIKLTAFERITKDMGREAITREAARAAKDDVRDALYDALRRNDLPLEVFERTVSSEAVYARCGIARKAKPRGRPKKDGAP
ncbi:MAG: DUF6076 domain-containing protein [Pseudoflavonifractor sp.]|nr:DUF6076 domain-containing protein [Pseudoflavonifractor sp.]